MRSNFGDYFSPEQRVKARKLYRVVEVLVIGGFLIACGGFTGWWMRDEIAQERRTALIEQHREEMERTTNAYKDSLAGLTSSLQYITGRVTATAANVDSLTATAENAANTAQKAANTAANAATQSSRAIQKSERVAEPTREQINRQVRKANDSLAP